MVLTSYSSPKTPKTPKTTHRYETLENYRDYSVPVAITIGIATVLVSCLIISLRYYLRKGELFTLYINLGMN